MANQLNINIVSSEKATGPIKKTTRAVKNLGKETSKVGKKSTQDFSGFGDLFSGVLPRGIQSTIRGFKGASRQIGRLSKSFKILKGAIAATGLGLLVVALGEIVANWDAISGAIMSASSETKDQVEESKKLVVSSQEQLDNISATENILKLQGKTEEDILAIRMAATDEAITAQRMLIDSLKQQKEEQVKAAEKANMAAQAMIAMLMAPISAVLITIDNATAGLAKLGVLDEGTNLMLGFTGGVAKAIGFDPEAVAEEGDKTIEKAEAALQKLENTRAGYTLRLRANEEKEKQKAQAIKDKADQKAEQDAQFRAERMLQIERDLELRGIEDEEQRAARKREMQYEDAKAQLEEKGATLEQLLLLEEQYEKDLTDIETKYRLLREENKKKADEKAAADSKKLSDDQLADAQKVVKEKLDLLDMQEFNASNSLESISNLNTLFTKKGEKDSKEAFVRQKKLSIAEALISTYFSAQKAYTSQLMPMPTDPTAPLRGTLAAAAAITAGLVRVKQIKNQEYNSGSTGGGGGGGGGLSPMQPFQAAVPLPARLNTPDSMQAYVVQSQLQGQMEMSERLNQQTVL